MRRKTTGLAGSLVLAIGTTVAAATAPAQPVNTAMIDAGSPNDWLTYHGSYKSYHYSPLDQINTGNVRDLQVAWIHVPGRSTRGLQSMPLAVDGVLYYTGSHSRTFALDGATGKVIWSYIPELDEALVARQTHSPYNRGAAIGEGKVFVGTVDGRLIALDMKTGKLLWDIQADQFAEADRRLHRRPALRERGGRDRRPRRRVAVSRPDLWRRRRDRPEEMGVSHRRRDG